MVLGDHDVVARPMLSIGAAVHVKRQPPELHCRTPYYLRGVKGHIVDVAGVFRDPSQLAFNKPGLPMRTLYRVCFRQVDIWPDYDGNPGDTVVADIFEHWLDLIQEDQHEHA